MYTDFPNQSDIYEGDQLSFTCQATNGNPRSVIRWEIIGNQADVNITQTNSTVSNVQISELTVTTHRSLTSVQCIGDQVHNKPSVYEEVKYFNVLCK